MFPKFMLGVRYIVSFRNWNLSKTKIKPHFALFDPPSAPVKLIEELANCLGQNTVQSSMLKLEV